MTKPAAPKPSVSKPRKPGGGRKPLPPGQAKNKTLTVRLPEDLYDYIKSLPLGSCEQILREHQIQSLIV